MKRSVAEERVHKRISKTDPKKNVLARAGRIASTLGPEYTKYSIELSTVLSMLSYQL